MGCVTPTALRAQATEILDRVVPAGAPCALLDFQNHGNVGDSAIWLGALAYLERAGCAVRYVSSKDDYDPVQLRRRIGDGPVLLSGGGNFGDVWPAHQRLRERVLIDLPDNPIVQLPQSIHYSDSAEGEKSRDVLARHRAFHLLVRDHRSLEIAERRLDVAATLCPDLVHLADLPAVPGAPSHAVVVLARDDHELRTGPPRASLDPPPEGCLVDDWLHQPRLRAEHGYLALRRLARWSVLPADPFARWTLAWTRHLATRRLEWGCRLLSRGRAIVTDRLHACLLGWTAGRPVYFVDNSYAKLSSYVDTWLDYDHGPRRCISFDEALERARHPTSPPREQP